jgi:hypothetical protein
MAISVITSGSQACTVNTEHELATVTAAGSYQLVLDVSALASGSTPDILRVRIYGKARSTDTERLEDDFSIVGAQARALFRSLPVWSPHHYRVTITQTQGTGRTIPWAIYGVQ